MKHVVRAGGTLVITTRSVGMPYDAWPFDFWRYELTDMRAIFGDLRITVLESDPDCPGVFMIATRPEGFQETELSDYRLFSVITQRRVRDITPAQERLFKVA